MKMSRLFTFMLALICICGLFSSGSYALWYFTEGSPDDTSAPIEIAVGEFTWTGSEELPDSVEGEDHAWLILNLVDGVNSSGEEVGLNNPNSELNEFIDKRLDGGWGWKRDYFGSMAVTGGSTVEDIFGTKAVGVSFLIEVVSDTEYYIYTTSVYLGERGEINFWGTSNQKPGKPSIPIGEYIYPIYQTKLTRPNKSSDWEIIETKTGKAKSDWYDENRSAANATQIPAFDKDTWVEVELGANPNTSEAIWTFIGDNPVAYATKSMPTVYYQITLSSSTTFTVSSDNLDAKISILASNGTELANSSTVIIDGVEMKSVNITGTAGTLYYIAVTGDDVINLLIN